MLPVYLPGSHLTLTDPARQPVHPPAVTRAAVAAAAAASRSEEEWDEERSQDWPAPYAVAAGCGLATPATPSAGDRGELLALRAEVARLRGLDCVPPVVISAAAESQEPVAAALAECPRCGRGGGGGGGAEEAVVAAAALAAARAQVTVMLGAAVCVSSCVHVHARACVRSVSVFESRGLETVAL
jgi:hypothetical protein